jgi:hypothetical protein
METTNGVGWILRARRNRVRERVTWLQAGKFLPGPTELGDGCFAQNDNRVLNTSLGGLGQVAAAV